MKFYFISPNSITPYLYETFTKTFQDKGHTITNNIREADVAFFDSSSGCYSYDWSVLNIVLDSKMPVVYIDQFDYHGDSSKYWFGFNDYYELTKAKYRGQQWAEFLVQANYSCKVIYLMRKMQTNANYGDNVYPFPLIQQHDHIFPITTSEELNSRPYDFCFIGCKSPRREQFIDMLLRDGRFKIDYQFTEERLPHEEWLNRHRKAKFFIEADGGGLGSERPYQLMYIAPMFKQKNLQKIPNDWIPSIECILAQSIFDLDFIHLDLQNPDEVYQIYLSGIKKTETYFSEEYRSNYILNILKENGIC